MLLASPLPDETLYSLVARSGRLRGDTLGYTTSRSLFGHPDAGLHHDFPHQLEQLAVNTRGYLGSVQAILTQLTAVPYFLRFKPPAVAISTQDAMAGIGIARLKHALGLPASLCRARLPLRACPECMEEDRRQHGVASWQRKHQLPGSLFCSIHAALLLESSLRIDRRGKSRFLLPEDIGVFKRTESPLVNSETAACLNRLANLNTHILERCLPQPYLRERMVTTYRHGLQANGLLTKGGSLRVQAYLNCLHSRFRCIQTLEPFCHALTEPHQATLLRIVRKPRTDFHPLYHSVLIDALFGGWEAFVAVYAWETRMTPAAEVENPSLISIAVPARISAFVAELNEPGPERPIHRLASQHGLDIGTAMRWAGKLGISKIRRRPKVLHHELKAEVVSALLRGEPQRDIAQHTGLSRATIDRICQEKPERYAAWQEANMEWKRSKARSEFLAYLEANPHTTLTDARLASPPGYCWLHRNDSRWLRALLPAKTRSSPRSSPHRYCVDWAARDELCFVHLCRLAANLSFESWERLKPGTLLKKLPALPFSPHLERLPKSRMLIGQILEVHIAKRHSRRK